MFGFLPCVAFVGPSRGCPGFSGGGGGSPGRSCSVFVGERRGTFRPLFPGIGHGTCRLVSYYNFNCVPLSTVNIFCPCYFSSRPGTYSLQALLFYRFLHISQFVLLSGSPLNGISCQTNVMITLSINIIIFVIL